MNNYKKVKELNIRTLLSESGVYIIPVYQRNYAWGESQIRQLIKDVIDSIPKTETQCKKYYIGTLIVDEKIEDGKAVFETIDGQQRLTTLNLLAIALKNHPMWNVDTAWFKRLNLDFSNRKLSANALKDIFNNTILSDREYHTSIIDAYELCISILENELSETNVDLKKFTNYLFTYVTILRVSVPPETDLNHYFEIMNNRGEQLEKHEVLKAKLLDVFNLIEDEKEKFNQLFHQIWEACSNMEKYVQYGFSVRERNLIFGKENWDEFTAKTFDELCKLKQEEPVDAGLSENETSPSQGLSIDEIIESRITGQQSKAKKEDNPDRFSPIINFSNFLLHVLRIQTKTNIPLDDKRLINVFEDVLSDKRDEEKLQFAKDFGYNLLKSKYLFDKYIIKRDTSTHQEEWSLLKMKCYKQKSETYNANYLNSFADEKQHRKLIQLLSMFHVSVPTLSYKHWLNAALNFIFENEDITADSYILFLEETAKQFVFNRIIAKQPQDYYNMIYHPKQNVTMLWLDNKEETTVDLDKLTFGSITNNLLFNYTDYLLWKRELEAGNSDSKITGFKFTSRSSVEHYFPQNPLNQDVEHLEERYLHSFGNLCLISHEKNSRLNNHLPQSKKDYYGKSSNIDSIKQYLMMQKTIKDWHIAEIESHEAEIFQLLKDNCN